MVQTGEFTPFGTKAWFAASSNTYDHWRGDGKIDKWQINGKIYQPLGSNGDFVSIAGHYNQNRNNNYNNPNLTDLRTDLRHRTRRRRLRRPATITGCRRRLHTAQWEAINSIASPSVCRDAARARPSRASRDRIRSRRPVSRPKTGCILGTRRPGLQSQAHRQPARRADQPVEHRQHPRPVALHAHRRPGPDGRPDLPVRACQRRQPGRCALSETDNDLPQQGVAGRLGVDLNGDGDTLDDFILVGRPSITNTNRITVISSLVWRMNPNNTFRVAYTYDRAHHRQTGEYGTPTTTSISTNPFFGRNGTPIITAAGTVAQNRDRTSIALLNQLSGQYIGNFFDNRLRLELGIRSPWFMRDLDQHCYTPPTSNFPLCVVNPTNLLVSATDPPGLRVEPAIADPATTQRRAGRRSRRRISITRSCRTSARPSQSTTASASSPAIRRACPRRVPITCTGLRS